MRKSSKHAIARVGEHAKAMVNLLEDLSRRHRMHQVFSDFCELAALTISNQVDQQQYQAREARYMQIVKGYDTQEVALFPKLLGHLKMWLREGMDDCLGKLFMQLELGNHWKGQFFTPYELAKLMARMTLVDVDQLVEKKGFITVQEPCVGAGAMVIAMAEAMQERGLSYRHSMHVTAVDVDITAVHMAYVQLSLLDVPAIVIHGNSLAMTRWSHWLTPAHQVHGWSYKLDKRTGVDDAAAGPPATQKGGPSGDPQPEVVDICAPSRGQQLD